jgi:YVTN family beta-propeller protein
MSRKPSPKARHLERLIVALAIVALALLWIALRQSIPVLAQGQGQPAGYKSFEAPQVHPLTITPDGTRLLAVNTPNNTLSVFHVTGRSLTLMAEIPVGLEPVSVAARNDREIWVTNWLSDSVSVVDLQTWNVTRTIDVGDEPTDVIFAGQQHEMAFVCVSGLSQVKVYDPSAPATSPQVVAIRGKQPRALARNVNGSQVFVSVFESGNQTTTVPANIVAEAGGPPAPNPAMSGSLPPAPGVGLIVKWNGSSWSDERSDGRWNPFIPYSLADVDVAVLDTSGATAVLSREIKNIGTHMGNAVVDPANNQLLVLNDEARNNIRFEPNLRGRFLSTRISLVNLINSVVTPVDLNQHIDYGNPAGSESERNQSLALPSDIARATDGTLYVAATSSGKVGVLDQTGAVQGRIAVGQGPTGLALNQQRNLLYVLNRFAESISIVDTTTRAQIATTLVGFNPEPVSIRRGRRFLYDASLSAHGDVSCASCHANGHRDGIAWDLGDPQGTMQTVLNPILGPFGFGSSIFHPMKGPMTTQSLRGIVGTEPLHWRGDRAQVSSFNPTFVSLLGGPRQLTPDEMTDFRAFIQSLSYPPNPNQNLDRTLPDPATGPSAARGALLFNQIPFDAGIFTCNQCHAANPGFGTGTNGALIPGIALQESQDFKVPQLRGEYQKTGFNRAAGEQLTGYGFIHDGSTDSLLNFLHAPVFVFQSENQRRDVEQFVLAFDSGIAPAVGLQTTANAGNKTSGAVTDRINLLMIQATAGNCDLIVRGLYNGASRGFLYAGNGLFQTDKLDEPPVSLTVLLQAAGARSELTFTGVPVGTGRRNALDQDGNGTLNSDEPLKLNAVNAPDFFVWEHYRDFLNRDPDVPGLNFWTGEITECSDPAKRQAGESLALCTERKRANTSAAFFHSPEYQNTGSFVIRVYWGTLGKLPNTPKSSCPSLPDGYSGQCRPLYNDYIADMSKVARGIVVNDQLDPNVINANKHAFVDQFVTTAPFKAKYESLNNQQFVDTLFQTTGINAGASDREALVEGLNAQPATETRSSVVFKVVDGTTTQAGGLLVFNTTYGQAFYDKEFDDAFVFMEYLGYLRRNPDQEGFDFWRAKLKHYGNWQDAQMVLAFISSPEYKTRFGQP